MIEDPNAAADPSKQQFLFYPNRHLLQPGLNAPVVLQENPKKAFQTVLRQLLVLHEVHPVLVEPAAIGGGSVLFGAQEVILACNLLVAGRLREEMLGACAKIMESCREISGNSESLYVFAQAAFEVRESGKGAEQPFEPGPPRSTLKGYGALLEDFTLEPAVEFTMDFDRLAALQVSLEEVYDGASKLLEDFYEAVIASPAPAPLAAWCEHVHEGVAKGLIPDHILVGEDGTDDGGRKGLLNLVPDLVDALRKG